MPTLYSMQTSGNCYKPRLLFALLGIPFRIVEVSPYEGGGTRTDEFLEKNPIGKVPLVEFKDGRRLAESNAMLLHFGEGTRFIPTDPFDRAKVYEWLFFEQYSHEPAIAVRRSILTIPQRAAQATPERLAQLLEAGDKALGVMERRLSKSDWLTGGGYSVADIALYAYTHDSEKGGFDLGKYRGVSAWIERVAAQPGHVPLDWRPAER